MILSYPQRIICLTEETTETLYAIGASDLIIGITQYTLRPPQAKKEKPIVARYIDARIDKIIEMKPDLVLAWSDLQANIASELIKNGIEVICFNHRSIQGILEMIQKLGGLIGKSKEAEKYALSLSKRIEIARKKGAKRIVKPKVYFEEWYDPIITGITWVSEIIEICGGIDIFEENRHFYDAKRRILADNNEVVKRNPDIMLASWCGMKFKKAKVLKRENWDRINAIKNDEIYDIGSEIILQPGPAALTDGIDIVMKILDNREIRNGK
ncbi:MAG: cobalamin-binding protein [Candidatus Kapabacteria bacterium]|nr:cobalamin-binding protein [Candidatus Kapabacteria bacterium]